MQSKTCKLKEIEAKWQKKWATNKIFETRTDPNRPKYFLNVPYPYMNGYLHIGFGVTFLHADIMARYKRMRGFNVLFPQAFHCTGMPVLAAANLVKEGNPAQIKILEDMGISKTKIPAFSEPLEWARYFPEAAMKDLKEYGASVDWTRTFITTELNPAYDQFVKWQFHKLRDKGYVKTGKHPVIWCPKDQQPVADHDRYEGEGETPVEYTLLKFPFEDKVLIAATLRPETVFGQTNLWVDPEVNYTMAKVNDEVWILSHSASEKLIQQDRSLEIIGEIKGSEFVGKKCQAPMIHRPIPILPTRFIDQTKGSGIVTSVPSDAPDDWIALISLKEDEEYVKKFNLDINELEKIVPIAIINIEGWGPLPAVEICEKMGITSLKDDGKLEKAKEEVYSSGFYKGVMNENCGVYAGMPVIKAKDEIKQEMLEKKEASSFWEVSGEVICRCRTPAIVKIVSDQWFLTYGNKEWKENTSTTLQNLSLYPEVARKQFEHVLDWLNDWACTHHAGLGTRLPWDERWVIESLSDSTIYMAYYTIAHIVQKSDFDSNRLTDAVFNYVFLNEGSPNGAAKDSGLDPNVIEEMKQEFVYWYPFDLRHSGKDLIQNHLMFCLFNHSAIFQEKLWPRAFGINGFVKVGTVRMSKSHGIATYLRDVISEYGADVVRLTLAQGGEGLDDPNYDDDFAISAEKRLLSLMEFSKGDHKTRNEIKAIDSWFRSILHRTIGFTIDAMEGMWHRTAIKHCYFDLQRFWTWYLRRCGGIPQVSILQDYIDIQARLLCPFTPHIAEEIWEASGQEGFSSLAAYPEVDNDAINLKAEATEEYIQKLLNDVYEIIKVTNITPKLINFYVAPEWKRHAYETAVNLCINEKTEMKTFMQEILKLPEMKNKSKELALFAPKLLDILNKMSKEELKSHKETLNEIPILIESKDFFESELGCVVSIFDAEEPDIKDPKKKAGHALPWKPAIYLE